MTNTEQNLEVAKECKCSLAKSLVGDGCRYCQPQEYIDRLHEALDEEREELSAANAAIAMKDEALKEIKLITLRNIYSRATIDMLDNAISTSPESLAAWEAEKLLPLQRQVEMLHKALRQVNGCTCNICRDCARVINGVVTDERTQATSEAYDREHAEKVLEEAAQWFEQNYSKVCSKEAILDCNAHVHLRRMAADLRAANKKEGE